MVRSRISGATALCAAMVLTGCVTLGGSASPPPGGFPEPAAGGVAAAAARPVPPRAPGPVATIGTEDPDRRYRTLLLNFTGGERVQLHYRVFERGGRTAMCGYLTADGQARERDAAGRWFQGAMVMLDDEGFGASNFLRLHPGQEAGARRPSAQCVESALAWRPQLAGATLTFRSGGGRGI